MPETILHERENWEEGESHLKDNGQKFQRHCVEILKLMYQGKRLHARQVEVEYNFDGRRLRDIFQHRNDCRREWKKDGNGKNLYMEYWLDIPMPLSKTELGEKTAKVINMMKNIGDLKQGDMFQ